MIHGLAGSAAIALLVLGTISNLRLAILYLAVFGLGAVFGMMFITATIASTIAFGERSFSAVGRHLDWTSGANGLFRAQVHWIAR
jgi:high-affinity nickel-transport protein